MSWDDPREQAMTRPDDFWTYSHERRNSVSGAGTTYTYTVHDYRQIYSDGTPNGYPGNSTPSLYINQFSGGSSIKEMWTVYKFDSPITYNADNRLWMMLIGGENTPLYMQTTVTPTGSYSTISLFVDLQFITSEIDLDTITWATKPTGSTVTNLTSYLSHVPEDYAVGNTGFSNGMLSPTANATHVMFKDLFGPSGNQTLTGFMINNTFGFSGTDRLDQVNVFADPDYVYHVLPSANDLLEVIT